MIVDSALRFFPHLRLCLCLIMMPASARKKGWPCSEMGFCAACILHSESSSATKVDQCHLGQRVRTNQGQPNLWLTLAWAFEAHVCDVGSGARLLSTFVRIGMKWAIDAVTSDGWWESTQFCRLLLALLPVWLLGACIGLLVRIKAVAALLHAITCAVGQHCTADVFAIDSASFCVQLPRPKWLATSSKVTYWLASPSGVLLRRLTLAVQGIAIARHV